jgi:aspartate/methionine/tyrosine aminotransferase
LREALAARYRDRYGVAVDPSRIVITAGASAALMLACLTLIDPGDEVLLTDPSYPCNRHFIAAVDGLPVSAPVGPASRFQMTEAALIAQWGPKVRGTLLATPANPTGTSIPFDELGRIVSAVRDRGGFAIVDEIYLDLFYGVDSAGHGPAGPHDVTDARTALEFGDDLVITSSFSKYFSMTGWRLGWMVLPPVLVPAVEKLAQNLFICPSALAQQAALACFEPATLAIYEQRKAAFRARRDYLVPALDALGVAIPAFPDGAFYVYADCSAFGLSSTDFALRLLDEADVCLVPGTDFGRADPERYLRISYATAMEQLVEAVARIGRFTEGLEP